MVRAKSSSIPPRQTNYKAGPGRPPGRKNNKTLAIEAIAEKALGGLVEVFDGDAHAFLAWVYKNPLLPVEVRIMAAGKALRVEKPVLSSVQSKRDVNINIAAQLKAARNRVTAMRQLEAHSVELVAEDNCAKY